MAAKKSKIPKTTKEFVGAVAVQACIYHLQRAQYHATARPAVSQQHQTRYLGIRETLNGARRRALDAMIPYLGAYSGPEVTEYTDVMPASSGVGGASIGIDVTEEVKAKLVAKAAREGRSLRAMVRDVLGKLVADEPTPPPTPKA
jgi:hypothetical protein